MIWCKKNRDFYRWHHCFAWHPRRVGDYWIWFERYSWCYFKEPPQNIEQVLARFMMPIFITVKREFLLSNGYRAIQEQSATIGSISPPLTTWHKPSSTLRVVGK